MCLNQHLAPVKWLHPKNERLPPPRWIMFHGQEAPENRLIFDIEAGGRGWGYILDIMLDGFIPVRRGDTVVMVLVPGSFKYWRGWA